MSTAADLVRRRRLAAAAFVALLILSVFWPSPVVSINDLCCHAPLLIDDLSFLGREALAWDVVFWCIAGLFALIVLHSARRDDFREARAVLCSMWPRVASAPPSISASAVAALVALTWVLAARPATGLGGACR